MIIWSDTSVIRKGVGVEAHRVDHRVFTRGVHLPVEYAVLGSCRLRPGPEAGPPPRQGASSEGEGVVASAALGRGRVSGRKNVF